MHWLSVNQTFFTLFDYQMSYIEFFGTLLNLISVFLVMRKNIWNWGIGNAGVLLFGSLFYQLHLYADLSEQIFFFITGVIGYFMWHRSKQVETVIRIRKLKQRDWLGVFYATIWLTFLEMYVTSHLDNWFPKQFPSPASYVFWDSSTTAITFVATYLMMKRFLENWYLWIVVDVVGIWLYNKKGVPFVAGLYVIFLGLAISGAIKWYREYEGVEHAGA